jgi:hypothetical protein
VGYKYRLLNRGYKYRPLFGNGRSSLFALWEVPTVYYIVTDLINALPGNSFINTVQHATIEEAVFSLDPTDAPIDWLDSDHVVCVYFKSMSVPWLYK